MPAVGEVEAVEHRAVGLVHAVAEDQLVHRRPPGELTVGSFRYGADFVQIGVDGPSLALAGRRSQTSAALNAPSAGDERSVPGRHRRGDEVVLRLEDPEDLGLAGPGLPSVLPVRCGLPR